MNKTNSLVKVLFSALFIVALSGCTAVKLVDMTAGAALGVGAGAVKATGAVAGAAIPDGDKDD